MDQGDAGVAVGEPGPADEQPTLAARPGARSVPPPRIAASRERSDSAPSGELATGDEAPTGLGMTRVGERLGIQTSRDFLRRDEAGRARTFSGAMVATVVLGTIFLYVLPGDPIARPLATGGLGVIGLGFLALFVHGGDEENFSPRFVGVIAHLIALASLPVAYYCGVFSPFPGVVAIALLIYALSSPPWLSLSTVLIVGGGQLLLALLVIRGVIDDRGLFPAEGVPDSVKIAGQGAVLLFYGIAFFVGRASNARTRRHVRDLETAVGQVAAREALLREARQELEQAAGIGDPGRFTEQQLGPWRLGPILGRGGMGEIYDATHTETGEPAALKLLLRGAYEGADPIQRFAREATIAASLRCPHVVRILDIGGSEAPLPYIAMERLHGTDLSATLRSRRTLKPTEVGKLAHEVASALDEAAEAAIVHRDLKPSNLFLTEDDEWKVLDFGVSKRIGEAGTLTGVNVVGTPAYMAPEQARGEAVDGRADVYSLAVILYRTLTGRPAFTGKDFPQMVRLVEQSLPPRPSSLASAPEPVDDVLRIGMAKDPADRFERASDLARAFGRALEGRRDPRLAARAAELSERLDWGG